MKKIFFLMFIDPFGMKYFSVHSSLAVTVWQKHVKQASALCEFYLSTLWVNWKDFIQTLIGCISTGCIYRQACELHVPLDWKMTPDSLGLAKTVRLTFQTLYTTQLSWPYSHSGHFEQLRSETIEIKIPFIWDYCQLICSDMVHMFIWSTCLVLQGS